MFTAPQLDEVDSLASPALVIDTGIVEANMRLMIEMAGRPDRLRPHCKTHKMASVTRLEIASGIVKHKAATIAEVEMLAREGAKDVLLAYPVVGPQIQRVMALRRAFPALSLKVLVDDFDAARALSASAKSANLLVDVMVDLDVGQHRTGAAPENWLAICLEVARLPGMRLAGIHIYDGHNNATAPEARRAETDRIWLEVRKLLIALKENQIEIGEIVAGGTGSFPFWAQIEDPRLILSPGTVVFYDAGYASKYRDLLFQPAVWVLSRVISRPCAGRITVDAGYKAVSGDPPLETRAVFPKLADAKIVAQNEEHLVLETSGDKDLPPGTPLWLIPWHICPTVALYRSATVIRDGKIVDEWSVSARDRALSI